MKYFRIGVVVAFIVTVLVFTKYYIENHIRADHTYPSIQVEEAEIKAPIDASDEYLLQGVTATDPKDGDITEKLIVESISSFIEPGVCKVTYAVCDADKHVAHASRKLIYEGYKKPQFTLSRALIYSVHDPITLKTVIGAEDVIDGDISENVILTIPEYETGDSGIFTIHAETFNSKGDTVSADFPLVVEDSDPSGPVIKLKKYIDYIENGSSVNPYKYLESATDVYGHDVTASVIYKAHKGSNNGLYTIDFYATDSRGLTGHTALIIMPEN